MPVPFTQIQTNDKTLSLLQSVLQRVFTPLIANPFNDGVLLSSVSLAATPTVNIINHKLERKLTGWFITRLRASSVIYDTQDTNVMPELTLQLIASNAVVADIFVF